MDKVMGIIFHLALNENGVEIAFDLVIFFHGSKIWKSYLSKTIYDF